ncbi:diguanylate cyclase [Fusibacter bizertensis]|uniref:Diguanylate cyclase n=1 Tax=Fusibacter bizertensis TaxID=1488331 RepID=A0ABT6NFQ5_9FIRM|nr:HD domain-containing phosphohydrolase [Fusibacter bizertensis]MDH8679246.1 diguanylate cyclase [Fusibacter bizertensis]
MSIYSKKDKALTREGIIGLGESSIRKNYYPELQDKISTLEKMKTRNQALMMAIPDILLVSDSNHHFTPFATSKAEEAALVLSFLREPAIADKLKQGVDEVILNRKPEIINFTVVSSVQKRHFEARFQLTELNEVLIIIRDMTQRTVLEEKLRDMAERDSSTNLYNRRKFEDAMLAYEDMNSVSISLIVFDIDGLKNINDTIGHLEGDRVIKTVADKINENFNDAVLISRIGGNEFAVIYEGISKSVIQSKCDAFNLKLDLINQNLAYEVSVSFGISHSNGMPINGAQLYQFADHNLYNHKLLKEGSSKSTLVKTLMKALEAKDYVTEGHTDRMSELAKKLGLTFGLEQHRMDQLTLLTKFHDLGKVGIPDNILKKPGPLTPDEWEIMKTHTAIGQRIASASPELTAISDLIYKHHEKWDGTGYPLGLKGKEIPLECRILSLVDSYDAMTNDRPYRKALTIKAAMSEIKRCSGTQFDPDMVKIFCEYIESGTV